MTTRIRMQGIYILTHMSGCRDRWCGYPRPNWPCSKPVSFTDLFNIYLAEEKGEVESKWFFFVLMSIVFANLLQQGKVRWQNNSLKSSLWHVLGLTLGLPALSHRISKCEVTQGRCATSKCTSSSPPPIHRGHVPKSLVDACRYQTLWVLFFLYIHTYNKP